MANLESVELYKSEKKTVLVFLHYFGGSADSWKWVIKELEPKYRCITINLPGFGGTPSLLEPSIFKYSNFIFNKIKELKIEKFVLIGHSMGGKLAVQCAIDDMQAGKILKLILVAPSPPSVEKMPDKKKIEMRLCPDETESKKSVQETIKKHLEPDALYTAVHTPMQVEKFTREWWIDKGISNSIALKSKKLQLPLYVFASKKDSDITLTMTLDETMANLPPHAALILNESSGHLIPLEDPHWLAYNIKQSLSPRKL